MNVPTPRAIAERYYLYMDVKDAVATAVQSDRAAILEALEGLDKGHEMPDGTPCSALVCELCARDKALAEVREMLTPATEQPAE